MAARAMHDEPTVFLVDDDATVREALGMLLESENLNVKAYPSAQVFLDEYDPQSRGCMVLDIRMPGLNGLELQDELRRRGITLPIIFLTGHGNVPLAVRAFRAGAIDFVEKPFNDELLLGRIQEALDKDAQTRAHETVLADACARYAQLTPREQEVMALVVAGESNKEIAAQLGLSIRTIDAHRASVMKKMQAGSLAELVGLAAACRGD